LGSVASGRAFTCERNQNIAVHVTAQFLARAAQAEMRAAPQAHPSRKAIVVLMAGLDASHLKERAGAEDAIAASEKYSSVKVARMPRRVKLDQCGGLVAELRSEIAQLWAELGDGGGTGAEPGVELLERVVVDQIKLDVFVAAAFTCLHVGLAEEVNSVRFSSAIGAGASSLCAGTSASFAAGTSSALGGGTFDAGSWARHATETVKNRAARSDRRFRLDLRDVSGIAR